ncbi:hypothetical protein GIB67_041655 [Kingdonia uniflora]|uniref:RNase H type-1 domain-containing protein n=1 Tax=Kingdonia uniflora TaxID=39325 RepID=A0A7J7MQS6_9MAGN|nr:hypothetical protein GIB67_041655 [Kingdonia uniflora]
MENSQCKVHIIKSSPTDPKFGGITISKAKLSYPELLLLLGNFVQSGDIGPFVLVLPNVHQDMGLDGLPAQHSSSLNDIKRKILVAVKDAAALGVPTKAKPLLRIQSCTWVLPWFQEVKINYGAAAISSPGKVRIGAVARSHKGEVLGVLTKGIGTKTLFLSECEVIISALYWAIQNQWNNILIESDSQTAIIDYEKDQVPWPQRARWNIMKNSFEKLSFSRSWKVANFSTSQDFKRELLLSEGSMESFQGKPTFQTKVEEPFICYFRFSKVL